MEVKEEVIKGYIIKTVSLAYTSYFLFIINIKTTVVTMISLIKLNFSLHSVI